MRTIVYVDGFNLYKAALSKSPYKWLNLHSLFQNYVIPNAQPGSAVICIKYFTARVKGKLCRNRESPDRQHRYMMAFKHYLGNKIEIIEGKHSPLSFSGRMLEPRECQYHGNWVTVEKMEEKQTDVNIALNMYRDSARNACDHLVLVSNDSDLAPAISLIKQDFPALVCGIVMPSNQRLSRSLSESADWTRAGLREEELARSQLPNVIEYRTGAKNKLKRLCKPDAWYDTTTS